MEVKTHIYLHGNFYTFSYNGKSLREVIEKCIAVLEANKPSLIYRQVASVKMGPSVLTIDLNRTKGHNYVEISGAELNKRLDLISFNQNKVFPDDLTEEEKLTFMKYVIECTGEMDRRMYSKGIR